MTDPAIALPPDFELSQLNGTNGVVIQGVTSSDEVGFSVSPAGDVNGDGLDDFILGAPNGENPSTGLRPGAAYVVFGSSQPWNATFALSTLDGSNGFALFGADNGECAGDGVAGAGDINGDGYDDLVIGASEAGRVPIFEGKAYVVFGAPSFPASVNLANLNGTNGVAFWSPQSWELCGVSVASLGDFNNDGHDDFALGCPSTIFAKPPTAGEGIVVRGAASFPASVDLDNLDGTNGFAGQGTDLYDSTGRSVGAAGDVNGDGLTDLLVGAPFRDSDAALFQAGRAWLVFGSSSPFPASLNLDNVNGTNGLAFDGSAADDGLGDQVSGAGDINGDGFADFLLGAVRADPGGLSSAGKVYLVYGRAVYPKTPIVVDELNGLNGVTFEGIDSGELAGTLGNAGDFDGDGFDDFLVGAQGASPNGRSGAGRAYLVFGRTAYPSATIGFDELNGTNGTRLLGIDPGDKAGSGVSAAGDVNGDGLGDILIGAPGANEAYLVFGRER